jgi:hypothetical protein
LSSLNGMKPVSTSQSGKDHLTELKENSVLQNGKNVYLHPAFQKQTSFLIKLNNNQPSELFIVQTRWENLYEKSIFCQSNNFTDQFKLSLYDDIRTEQ